MYMNLYTNHYLNDVLHFTKNESLVNRQGELKDTVFSSRSSSSYLTITKGTKGAQIKAEYFPNIKTGYKQNKI